MRLEKSRRHKLRVHWPMTAETFERFVGDSTGSVYSGKELAALTEVIQGTPELGDFGTYTDVVEFSLGYESFVVGNGANATMGTPGQRSVSPTLVLTTYLNPDLPDSRLDEILEALVSAHPWEVPVIELTEIVQLVPPALADAAGVRE